MRKYLLKKKKSLDSAKKKKTKTIVELQLTDVLICIARNRPHSFLFFLAVLLPSLFQPQSSISAFSLSLALSTPEKKP